MTDKTKRRYHRYNPLRIDVDPEAFYTPIGSNDPGWNDCCPCEPNTPQERQEAIDHPCTDIGPNPMTTRFLLTLTGFSGPEGCGRLNGSWLLVPTCERILSGGVDCGSTITIFHTDFGPCKETPTDRRNWSWISLTDHLFRESSDVNNSRQVDIDFNVFMGSVFANQRCRLEVSVFSTFNGAIPNPDSAGMQAYRLAGEDWTITSSSASGDCNAGSITLTRQDKYCTYALDPGEDPENSAWDVQIEAHNEPQNTPFPFPPNVGCNVLNGPVHRMEFFASSSDVGRHPSYLYRYTDDQTGAYLELLIAGDLLVSQASRLRMFVPQVVNSPLRTEWLIYGEGDYVALWRLDSCYDTAIVSLARVDGV